MYVIAYGIHFSTTVLRTFPDRCWPTILRCIAIHKSVVASGILFLLRIFGDSYDDRGNAKIAATVTDRPVVRQQQRGQAGSNGGVTGTAATIATTAAMSTAVTSLTNVAVLWAGSWPPASLRPTVPTQRRLPTEEVLTHVRPGEVRPASDASLRITQ
jgi:hypothetical protein